MHRLQLVVPDRAAMAAIARTLAVLAPAGTTLLLEGNLGSGKTTFVQWLGAGLGIDEPITSPTFALVNEYCGVAMPLYHADLYRLDRGQARSLCLDAYWRGEEYPLGIVAIEWPDRLDAPPSECLQLTLAAPAADNAADTLGADGDEPRSVDVVAYGRRHSALLADLARALQAQGFRPGAV